MNFKHANDLEESWYVTDIKEDRHTFELKLTIDYDDNYISHARMTAIDTMFNANAVRHYEVDEIVAENVEEAKELLTNAVHDMLDTFYKNEI